MEANNKHSDATSALAEMFLSNQKDLQEYSDRLEAARSFEDDDVDDWCLTSITSSMPTSRSTSTNVSSGGSPIQTNSLPDLDSDDCTMMLFHISKSPDFGAIGTGRPLAKTKSPKSVESILDPSAPEFVFKPQNSTAVSVPSCPKSKAKSYSDAVKAAVAIVESKKASAPEPDRQQTTTVSTCPRSSIETPSPSKSAGSKAKKLQKARSVAAKAHYGRLTSLKAAFPEFSRRQIKIMLSHGV